MPNDKDFAEATDNAVAQLLFSVATAELNVEYKNNGVDMAQVCFCVLWSLSFFGATWMD